MLKANNIKISLIKWLIENNPDCILGNEVLFSINSRRADLLMIKDNLTYAFEIKSERDNIQKLEEQLNDYSATFDYTTLIITPKHRDQVIKLINNKIGIYIIEQDNINIIRKSKKQTLKDINVLNLIEFIDKSNLLKMINKKGLSKLSIFDLREIALRELSKKRIKQVAMECLKARYYKLFELFKIDTNCSYISKDDLRSLTGNIKSSRIF